MHNPTTKTDAALSLLVQRTTKGDEATFSFGARLLPVQDGSVRMRLIIEKRHLNGHQICHGGVLATLLDAVAGLALCEEGHVPVTAFSSLSYFRPVFLGDIVDFIGERSVASGSRRVAFAQAIRQNKEVLATMSGTFRMLPKQEGTI